MRMIAMTALLMSVSGAAWSAPNERTPCVAFNAASINAVEVARISAEAVADAQSDLMRQDLQTRARTEAALDRFERADLHHRTGERTNGERTYRIHSDHELTPEEEARIEAQVEAALERAAAATARAQHLSAEQQARIQARAAAAVERAEHARARAAAAHNGEGRYRIYTRDEMSPEQVARLEAQIEAAVASATSASVRVAEVMARVEARMAEIESRNGLRQAELTAEQEAQIEAALERAEAAIERAAEAMERAQERRRDRLEGGDED
ncbi:tolA protein [alpha proteobacterium U9-1i]|nr:tolA protein [alpha proteobacterium U9-1i]